MDIKVAPHEKVRFRREDYEELENLPSASLQHPRAFRRSLGGRLVRTLAGLVAVVATLVVLAAATAYLAGVAGIGSERLRSEAEAAIRAIIGGDVRVETGAAHLSLDPARFMVLEVPDIRLTSVGEGRTFTEAGSLRFGFRVLPLLTGELKLRSVTLADARIVSADIPAGGKGDWAAGLRDERGLLDPDLIAERLLVSLGRFIALLENRSTRRIALHDVEFVLAAEGPLSTVMVRDATISSTSGGAIALTGDLLLDGWTVSLSGEAEKDEIATGVGAFRISMEIQPLDGVEAPGGGVVLAPGQRMRLAGGMTLDVSGGGGVPGAADKVEIHAVARNGFYAMPNGDAFAADLDIRAVHTAGGNKIEISRLGFAFGRSTLAFHGAIGPTPDDGTGAPATYRYEFVSDGSTAAALDAPEPALQFVSRVAGTFDPASRLLQADEIGVRTRSGSLVGKASVGLAPGIAPSLALALDIPSMPVSHAKQLWPVDAARGARAWVMGNLFGGTVKNSRLRLTVPAGRLGNGVPLSGEEIWGHFEIDDTRFDVTGDIPPVRDAFGVLDFRGNDIDIALRSGTVFMPTGRTVAARDGTFAIRRANVRPVIGKLDIDIAGDAPSVLELASYKPMDAMRHLDFVPEDFEGDVDGKVIADIPLQRDFPVEKLDWNVALSYRDLSISKPVEGRQVSGANGSIVVDPQKAVIAAKAMMDGAPATIEMTEPLGTSPVERLRDITVTLDEAARARIAPELNTMLSGPVTLEVDAAGSGAQSMRADLTAARLDFPWVGWSKGAGVPARAGFRLEVDGETTRLSDFTLSGESFGAEGEILLRNGALARARFARARLNRGDSISLDIEEAGKGYAITARGSSYDARSVIKLYLADTETAEENVKSIPVTVDARVGSVTGFGGERMSDLEFSYSGTGTLIGTLKAAATTDGGSRVTLVNDVNATGRTVTMKSADAGSILRFLDIYEYMQGGSIDLSLAGPATGPLTGQVETRDFQVVDDPMLKSVVATPPPDGDGRSLNQAIDRQIDVSRASFERGFSRIEKGPGYLRIDNGVLRGPVIGATFQGDLYDRRGNMSITGTFMPAYGVNRLFAEIPLFGQILGNGRDRGLIGITFKLSGAVEDPQLQVNPISIIAPGIFRSIFEYN